MTTIIRPHSERHTFGWFQILAVMGLLTMVSLGVFLYNQVVNLQHQISEAGKVLTTAKTANVDLKNQLYQTLDVRHLITLAGQFDLTEVRNPEFLELELDAEQTLSSAQ